MASPPAAVISVWTAVPAGVIDIGDDDLRALGGKELGGGAADAVGRAGDDGDFTGEVTHRIPFL